jgi:predicted RNA-binding Zn ribbon-like protein
MRGVIAPGEDARPALALVNSRRNGPDGPIDDLATPAAAAAWLTDRGFAAAERLDLTAMHELRAAVREVLVARIEDRVPDAAAVAAVNEASAAAPTVRRLVWAKATPEAREEPAATGAALARALLAADAIDLVTGPDHRALRACGAPGCVRLLLRDHPRRQWCSTRCGDRVRASRYYYRHRPANEAGLVR